MSWSTDEQKQVATALLGSWPAEVTRWGPEGIAAYISVLQARGLDAEQVLLAIHTYEGNFVPSAPELAGAAQTDLERPTWTEAFRQMFGRGERHWIVEAFVQSYGRERLGLLPIYDDEYGAVRQQELRSEYEQFAERQAMRNRRDLVGRTAERRGLQRPDFQAGIGGGE